MGPYLKKYINALEKVQHRATKIITPLRKLPYEQRLKKCNLTTLEERRKRGDLLETHLRSCMVWSEYQKLPPLSEVILCEGGTL